ncbi:MAG: hypothetical protein JSS32_01775 [Verrucomicrobia bacterium]|nr:hypothetical protein [Verrucomicrobiota bacterium]
MNELSRASVQKQLQETLQGYVGSAIDFIDKKKAEIRGQIGACNAKSVYFDESLQNAESVIQIFDRLRLNLNVHLSSFSYKKIDDIRKPVYVNGDEAKAMLRSKIEQSCSEFSSWIEGAETTIESAAQECTRDQLIKPVLLLNRAERIVQAFKECRENLKKFFPPVSLPEKMPEPLGIDPERAKELTSLANQISCMDALRKVRGTESAAEKTRVCFALYLTDLDGLHPRPWSGQVASEVSHVLMSCYLNMVQSGGSSESFKPLLRHAMKVGGEEMEKRIVNVDEYVATLGEIREALAQTEGLLLDGINKII